MACDGFDVWRERGEGRGRKIKGEGRVLVWGGLAN